MDSQHIPPAVGTLGLLGTMTISDANELMALLVGTATMIYLIVRIYKEIKSK